ncbi:hypothetical protein [Virgibacillus oceani]|uniref:Uncharacterized protein n=1 Tax=Virgibacillus oceani TaxID=1479511 RepID=A0A917M1A0_9BACI|nr:hypothetical protein [Virgibacillus oceani]GGG72738.1 hypothetical protein GCM10011398_16370 [Virgibacillus oceani]
MKRDIPDWLENWISIQDTPCDVVLTEERAGITGVEVKWGESSKDVSQMQLTMELTDPDIQCVWKPHLSPEEDMVVGDFVFRSPAIIFEKADSMFALIPDIDFLNEQRTAPHVMDYVDTERKLFYGLGHYEKTKHVYHRSVHKSIFLESGQTLFRFYLAEWKQTEGKRDFTPVVTFLWERFGKRKMAGNTSSLKDLEIYAKHAYDWAFNRWENVVWQEFEHNQKAVGGCVFIVRAAQSPGRGEENNWRERKSLWNQAWFSSLRSAYGYRLWGDKWNNPDMIRRAELAKNFALAAPQTNGLFPSVYWANAEQGWENGNWGHSDRRPEHHEEYGHLLDMSWTCLWMLKWYRDIEQNDDLLAYSKKYAERLLKLQHANGSFPAWVHEVTGKPSPYLFDSPETSMHVWLLSRLYSITEDDRFLEAAERGMEFVMKHIIPHGRWEDFELYWSCSRSWDGKKYGEKDKRSGLYNQCNFSIYWTAEALKELYAVTKEEEYLLEGEKVLAELSLYQAIWEPHYLGVPTLGGFGVMTSDDEWNDARHSLFALTYLDYFNLTGKEEYHCRGIWAMRASFYLMYCPENPLIKERYEKTFPHFGERDYGFEMENSHHGENDEFHTGEFTIFDWGNGSAASSLGEILVKGY